jgi:iron complex outermembrane receptor protein
VRARVIDPARSMRSHVLVAYLAIGCTATGAALAQRAGDNAVTDAEDAFGTQVDQQSIGLYSPSDARGFSPQLAGNLRLDGLYISQVTTFTNPCLVRETAMRVGVSADPFIFPAPTGIADSTLRAPGQKRVVSVLATHGSLDGETVTVEAQLPLTDQSLALDLCAAFYHNNDIDYSTGAHGFVRSAVARWKPGGSFEIVPFVAVADGGEQHVFPVVYTDGAYEPVEFNFSNLSTSDRAKYGWRHITAGLIARGNLGDRLSLSAGIFRSEEHDPSNLSPLYFVRANGNVDVVLDESPRLRSASWSGEIRGTRAFQSGAYTQRLALSIRGRATNLQFGGDRILDLGSAPIFDQTSVPETLGAFGSPSHDIVRQGDLGVAYEIKRQNFASFTIGVLRDQYQRSVEEPGSASTSLSKSHWLTTARLTVDLAPGLLLYGSEVQGIEDSPLAPASAVNRGELPPASLTKQVDAGLRLRLDKSWQFVVGAFQIRKPYFNLDDSGFYRGIGELQHRGVETSVSFADRGVTIIAGAVVLQPRDERASLAGRIVEVPLGPVPGTFNVNADAAPDWWKGWGASLQWRWLSSRSVTNDGSRHLAPLSTLNIGGRYYRRLVLHPWSVRLDIFNVANDLGIHVSSVGQLLPEQPRRAVLTLAVDY